MVPSIFLVLLILAASVDDLLSLTLGFFQKMRGRIGSVLRAVCTFEVNFHGELSGKKIGKKEKSLSKMAKPEIVRTSSLLAPSLSSRGT